MAGLGGRGVPLRVGLVAATLVLVACGLLASGIAVTSILRHSLTNRVDQTLLDASRSWAQAPRRMPVPPMEGPNPARPPSDFYVRGIDADGRIWMAVNDRDAEPLLPPNNDVGPDRSPSARSTTHTCSGERCRCKAPRRADDRRHRSVRRPVDGSRADLVAGGHRCLAVLLVLGIAGFGVVHRSLRPLIEVERTAADIASGQLDRRIPNADPRTEVGRLSLALNGMLAQIQRAVASSESSADRREDPRSGCAASSPMPATNCVHR